MDFQVAAPGGVAAGNPAALAARGADPAIQIPAVHFFRRINGLTLQPVAGALVPVPTTLALSVVELVLGCTVSTNGVAVVEDLSFPVVGVLPAKYEAAFARRLAKYAAREGRHAVRRFFSNRLVAPPLAGRRAC